MRHFAGLSLLAGSLVCSTAAWAGEEVVFAPVPEWVTPPPAFTIAEMTSGKAAIPLYDVQTFVDGDATVSYTDGALAISSPEMLGQLGTISFSWQPAHGDLTVHKVEIWRDGAAIDLLAQGGQFSVLRREARLEDKVIDGMLTAMMPAAGLRVGDVLRVAHSVSVRDTTLGGAAQGSVALIGEPATMKFGRARLVWPGKQDVAWKSLAPGVEAKPARIAGGRMELVVPLPVAKPPELPKGTPLRFQAIPLIEASTFGSWDHVSQVMAPLYRTEGTIAEGSPLAEVTDAIAAAHSGQIERLAAALRVVQSDVRYQLIALGDGNYVPQSPADTWEKRYGDCKAKTLLLLAMLDRLGIEAEAALANSRMGDLVPSRLPTAMAFDHVFVHAEVDGESFWLDGTSLGARLADLRDVPNFGWALPLRDKGAEPLRLPNRAKARPAIDMAIAYDASASVHLPAPYTMQVRYAGPYAEHMRSVGLDGDETLVNLAERTARSLAGFAAITKPASQYDEAAGTWTLEFEGVGSPDFTYRDGKWESRLDPLLKVDFDPDRSRATWRDLPALAGDPDTTRLTWSMRLPLRAEGFVLENAAPASVATTAFLYDRTISPDGLTVSDTELLRETGAEVAAADVGATRRTARDLAGKSARIVLPAAYPQRWDDVDAALKSPALARARAIMDRRIADKPDDASRLSDRAWLASRLFDWKAAEKDYAAALALDPTISRHIAHARVLSQMGDHKGALKDAQAAFDLDADNEDVRNFLAGELADLGRLDDALALLDPDPDLSAKDGEAKVSLRAELLSRGGRTDELLTLLGDALDRRGSSTRLLNARCWFRALADRELEGALADCNRAIELASNPAAYFDSRAMVHFRAGRMAEARADLDAALELAPELAPTRFMRGIVAARSGQREAGAADLAAARRISPSIDAFFARYGIKP